MFQRALRAIKADPEVFELVEHDDGYTGEAGIIVAITSVLAAFGVLFGGAGFLGFVGTIIAGLIGWFVWAGLTFVIGARLFGGTADYGEMLRVTGFAHAPHVLSIIPFAQFLTLLWSLWVAIVAIRQGLDLTTGKAIAVALLGWLVMAILRSIFFFV
ncbi:MAG: YIP1 family protein [Acidimicrobiia bacterium]|nr:YIP1 family protein [Acidimicrobiia bacterium]